MLANNTRSENWKKKSFVQCPFLKGEKEITYLFFSYLNCMDIWSVNLPCLDMPLALFTHARLFFSPPFLGMAKQCGLWESMWGTCHPKIFFKNFLRGPMGHLWGGWRRDFFLVFCVDKGYDDGMSFNKELQKFNIPYYSLFKQLKKEIYMCYYVTQIWKGRKNTQTTLEGKSHQRNKNCFL
jgi:hypothetical protein